jgi:hypothetical protein
MSKLYQQMKYFESITVGSTVMFWYAKPSNKLKGKVVAKCKTSLTVRDGQDNYRVSVTNLRMR